MGAPNPYELHPQVAAQLQALLEELPPLTEDQLDALCDTVATIRGHQ